MEPIIFTKDLCRTFRAGGVEFPALRNIGVRILPGELTLLRGRSGSGKTTLLNLLSALDRPTSGEIWFQEHDIAVLSETQRDALRRTRMGFVFQAVALISQMTAYENVEFGLRVAGYERRARRERAEQCLRTFGLGQRMHHMPGELSGGEQQRVAIARAIAHRPPVIFADEPTAELDSVMSMQVMHMFRDLSRKEGTTAVITTHDPRMMELADRVYTLEDGVIIDEVCNARTGEGEAR